MFSMGLESKNFISLGILEVSTFSTTLIYRKFIATVLTCVLTWDLERFDCKEDMECFFLYLLSISIAFLASFS